MKLKKSQIVDPFKYLKTRRPWGYFDVYAENEICTSKILFIKQGESLSMQYHFRRDQFYYILDNGFTIEYSKKPVEQKMIDCPNDDERITYFEEFLKKNMVTRKANEGDMFGFHRRVIHRAAYDGPRKHGRLLDMAFGVNDEEDIVRILDKYGRKSK